jgi:hypothetical protein
VNITNYRCNIYKRSCNCVAKSEVIELEYIIRFAYTMLPRVQISVKYSGELKTDRQHIAHFRKLKIVANNEVALCNLKTCVPFAYYTKKANL